MPKERTFKDTATTSVVSEYLNDLCGNPDFLCDNRDLCSKNSLYYGNIENIDKICVDMKKALICPNNVDTCLISIKSEIPGTDSNVVTTFMNIIIPIPNSYDTEGNKKFIRLPPLSGSISVGSDDICSSCACVDRFAKSPGSGNTEYTAPGQDTCVYSNNFSSYYYPLDLENIRNKLQDSPAIYINGDKIVNSNIIYTNNNEDIKPDRLYDILYENNINHKAAYNFITNVLYKNNTEYEKILNLHITEKKKLNIDESTTDLFVKNIVSFYIIFITFIILILFNAF